MGKEIEVKYLVNEIPHFHVYDYVTIYQGYLAVSDTCEVRVRKIEPSRPPLDISHKLTIKSLESNFRTEIEKEITKEEFKELWKLSSDTISKYRHYGTLKFDERRVRWKFELDEYITPFHSPRLLVCEIEFKDEDDYNRFKTYDLPDWLGDEITDDSRYKNRNISNTILETLESSNKT